MSEKIDWNRCLGRNARGELRFVSRQGVQIVVQAHPIALTFDQSVGVDIGAAFLILAVGSDDLKFYAMIVLPLIAGIARGSLICLSTVLITSSGSRTRGLAKKLSKFSSRAGLKKIARESGNYPD